VAHAPAPSDPKFDPHFAAIGRLVDRWAHLEHQIDLAIWATAHVEQMFGACITAQLIGVNGRLRALRALLELHGASEASLKKLGAFATAIYPLQIKRNRAAHDPRMVSSATQALDRLELTAANSLVFDFQPEDAGKLQSISDEIGSQITAFRSLFGQILNEIKLIARNISAATSANSSHEAG